VTLIVFSIDFLSTKVALENVNFLDQLNKRVSSMLNLTLLLRRICTIVIVNPNSEVIIDSDAAFVTLSHSDSLSNLITSLDKHVICIELLLLSPFNVETILRTLFSY